MKNTYLYGVLMWLFLLMGKVEVVCGQQPWYESDTWESRTIKEDIIINLTKNIKLSGTITINNNCTLTINNLSNQTFTIQAVANSTMFSNSGSLIIKGNENSRIVLDGGANFEWSDNHSEMPYMRLTEGEGSKKIGDAINNTGSLSLSYVTIQNVNSSNDNGGAIQTKSTKAALLDNCIIQLCKARLGSAVMLDGGASGAEEVALKISNSLITKCVSGGDASNGTNNVGGAIRTYGSTKTSLYLTNVTMSYNYAMREYNEYNNTLPHDGNGGALFWNARGQTITKCVIDGCTFTDNISEDNGGAIKAQGTIEFVNNVTKIYDNKAPNGAGLYIEGYTGGANTTIKCTINYNLNEYLEIKDNTAISYEYAGVDNPGKGAGVHFYLGKEMSLMNESTINIYMDGATIQNNEIKGNGGLGGGIYFEDTALEKKKYTFNIKMNYGNLLNNTSTGNGGGMYISKGNIQSEEVEGKEMVITGNTALLHGGGIYIEDGSFTMSTTGQINDNSATSGDGGGVYVGGNFTMTSGTIGKNHAKLGNGGGVYVNKGSFNIEESGTISTNYAGTNAPGNGAGVYINGGNFTMNNGNISGNVITQGNGGGVYVNGGKLVFNNGAIMDNEAGLNYNGNGGGICLLNGEVTISEGKISGNKCGQYGGGLYVYNLESTSQAASFNGGTIINNTAKYGGGVCVDGNIDLTIGTVTVDENMAVNGGGICLLNGAKMDFGQGYIRENKAVSNEITIGTAYQKTIGDVKGIGGGIFLDSNTELKFSVVDKLGLYDNLADGGADDIFANGNGTKVLNVVESVDVDGLPVVSTMELADFGVAGKPYWVEDYLTDDTSYDKGTQKKASDDNIRRYRNSIQNLQKVYQVEEEADLKGAMEKYLCLAIGHDVVYVTIKKTGLQLGESAIFTIEAVNEGTGTDDVKRTVLLTGDGEATVSKTVALATGKWKVTETSWTWAYTSSNGKSITKQIVNGDSFEFVNTKKETLPLHDEAKKENSMNPPKGL